MCEIGSESKLSVRSPKINIGECFGKARLLGDEDSQKDDDG